MERTSADIKVPKSSLHLGAKTRAAVGIDPNRRVIATQTAFVVFSEMNQ
jgi:hypothetical protein